MMRIWLKLLRSVGLLTWWMRCRGWEADRHSVGGRLHYHKGTRMIYEDEI